MDESAYMRLADEAFDRIEDALKDVDPDEVECERAGDVLTLTFRGGARCVVNTQRPTRQLWLAANARAWHFAWDGAKKQWLDDKAHNVELFDHIARTVKEAVGVELSF